MDNREKKSFPSEVRSIEGRVVKQIFSTFGVVDMYRDVIRNGAFKKTISERKDRIKVLWQHDLFLPPIAALKSIYEIGEEELPVSLKEKFPEATGGLEGEIEYLQTERGEEVFQGIKAGAITENSIGFDPIQSRLVEHEISEEVTVKIRELTEIRLWDLSPVNWGANPATANRSAVPFKGTGITHKGDWPPVEDFGTNGEENIAGHYALVNRGVLHHVPSKSGIGPAHWAGVELAMFILLDAMVVPDAEKEAVYTHLAKHYVEFGVAPPPYKLVELAYSVRDALTLGEDDLKMCYEQLTALQVAMKAEPIDSKGSITHFGLDKLRVQALKHYIDSV